MPHILTQLFDIDPESLSPYLQKLRTILAQTMFIRVGDISITSLVEQIKDFNRFEQKDAEEEFSKILNCLKDDCSDKSVDMLKPITGVKEIQFVYNSKIIKTIKEPFLLLSLRIQDMSNIYQALEYSSKPSSITHPGVYGSVTNGC